MAKITIEEATDTLLQLFLRAGITEERASRLADLYVLASRDGVYSHGLHFVPHLLRALERKTIHDPNTDPITIASFGAIERCNGLHGLGPLNAQWCMNRAIALTQTHGIGCVALRNTNHWGRAGNVGWQAAEAGHPAICWTNTVANQPPWGSSTIAIGNNPLVLAAPGPNGQHLVLDIAMSQFSMGRLNTHRLTGEPLPVVGGVDKHQQPTRDAAAILEGGHAWPMGYWKGSGLTVLLDALASILADGNTTAEITAKQRGDHDVSQVYIAFAPTKLGGRSAAERTEALIRDFAEKCPDARYPGQAALQRRQQSIREGIWVDDTIWDDLTSRASS